MRSDSGLEKFLDAEGKVTTWPAKPVSQRLVLTYLASKFVFGMTYSEKAVTVILDGHHTFGDAALLRRELVMKDLLERTPDGRQYWKKGDA